MTDLSLLSEIGAARARLDERELELIDRARHDGATWAEIAGALGLSSRQAAEQRRQRLVAARRARLGRLDRTWSAEVVGLRAAVTDLDRWIAADRAWDGRFRRAALVRRTCASALDAAPGPLFALAAYLVGDLAGVGPRLPAPARDAAGRIAAALSTKD
ncbi:hypothetical protein O7602_11200 [Micromonospora sp. WMMD1128]|uniref:hypothetical protein n=1 Tax=Micromonospora sp. WMMD1128 TaxID=3015150 RepID=UPI00248BC800|nr:hypothetical protein [Micromonospora sp. WMMD1128]WBB76042.1 hypothetical protein O7602_11200 [Micromonospora sp. WMMD1128]